MSLTRAQHDVLAFILVKHIEPLFKPGVKITLLVRLPGNDEADVLVSSDTDLQAIHDMIERSKSREVIGGPK